MITAYHRPKTLEEALKLLTQPGTVPLGGGTLLSHASTALSTGGTADSVEAVDLQLLGLDALTKNGNDPSTGSGQRLELGATLTLQSLLESEHCPEALKRALKLEAPINIRNMATTAGTIVACDGRSPFVTALLAMDAKIEIRELQIGELITKTNMVGIGDLLPLREQLHGKLITKIIVPLNIDLAFESVARTPSDTPIVCVAVAGWASGRTRMAVGGYGKSPMLAMDGAHPSPSGRGTEGEGETDGIIAAARNAFHEATDEFGSAEYRMDVAATLAKRCVEGL